VCGDRSYVVAMSEPALEDAVRRDPVLARGVNVYGGSVTNPAVAEAHGKERVPLSSLISGLSE
jgi:alanine dehydrogenase